MPGQATEVSIMKEGWGEEKRPFTFTSVPADDFLEFVVKSYTDHPGVTNEFMSVRVGDTLLIDDPWGTIDYGGPGYFIAGGAGITPFLSIIRQLAADGRIEDNRLFFSNRTAEDVILGSELEGLLGGRVDHVITGEGEEGKPRFIDESFLRERITDVSRRFYVCGPPAMVAAIGEILVKMGASPEAVVFEK
jgi:ferredoxin-NADP reductase